MSSKTSSSEASDREVTSVPSPATKSQFASSVESRERGSPATWQTLLLALVVITSFFLGSGRDTWSQGAVCCLLGLVVFCCPPQFRLPKVATLSLLVLGLVPLIGLLPLSWSGVQSPWRDMLWLSWGIKLPETLSPDPRATFESWLLMVVAVIWLWVCLGHKPGDSARRWCLYGLALGGVGIAIASLVDYYMTAIPWWPRMGVAEGGAFGPFSNRNHTSSLNAITCILCVASAYDAYRRKSHWGWLFMVAACVPLATILMNTSRGGMLLLIVGLIVWVTTSAMKRGLIRKAAVGVAVLLVVASIASVSSGRLGSRLRMLMQEESVSPLTSSLRLDLAKEMISLSADRPWLGRGFDTFPTVFPLVTQMDIPHLRFWHPESDVMLLLFEGGLLALVPCGVLLTWFACSTGSWRKSSSGEKSRDRSGRRLRQVAAIGAGMAVLHSIFDVPNHVLGYGMHTALLMGLAIRPRKLTAKSSGLESAGFRLLGGGIVALGVMWLGIGFKKWTPDLPSSVEVIRERAFQEIGQKHYREALGWVDHCLWLAPLDYRLYYLKGQLLLQLGQRPERALVEFGRSRALEPNYAKTCYEEGEYWLSFVPEMAMIPWRECLRREPRDSEALNQIYRRMLSVTAPYPELRESLWRLAENVPMQISFLEYAAGGDEWEKYSAKFLQSHLKLDLIEPQYLRTWMRNWHDRGDREKLVMLLEENPSLQPYGWRTMAAELARKGRYEEALLMANRFMKRQNRPVLIESSGMARLERAFVFNPTDVRPGVELYYAQRAAGDLKGAKVTAEKVNALPEAPPYMKLELASVYSELKEHRRAWEAMEQAMAVIPDA